MGGLKRSLYGNPEVHEGMFGGSYVTIDGTNYQILRRSGDNNKWIVKECEGAFSCYFGEEKVVEKDWLGQWRVRNKGMWE
jgi:hypothetical protein